MAVFSGLHSYVRPARRYSDSIHNREMDEDDLSYAEIPTGIPAERALDVATFVMNALPWLGSPIAGVLSGISTDRKIARVNEVVLGLVEKLRDFESAASKQFVKTEEFEELLEQTLRQVATERNADKRRMYRDFLLGAIESPGEPYDEQKRFLRTMEDLQADHLRVLKALAQEPQPVDGLVGSQIATLRARLSDLSESQIEERVQQLNDMRVVQLHSLRGMMTPRGAEDLRHAITPYGVRFLRYLVG